MWSPSPRPLPFRASTAEERKGNGFHPEYSFGIAAIVDLDPILAVDLHERKNTPIGRHENEPRVCAKDPAHYLHAHSSPDDCTEDLPLQMVNRPDQFLRIVRSPPK